MYPMSLVHDITKQRHCAPSECSDQSRHPSSLYEGTYICIFIPPLPTVGKEFYEHVASIQILVFRERSGSVVKCLTRGLCSSKAMMFVKVYFHTSDIYLISLVSLDPSGFHLRTK